MAAPFAVGNAAAAECRKPPIFYQTQGYTVRGTRVDSPLRFLPSVALSLRSAAASMESKPDQPFDVGWLTRGVGSVRKSFSPLKVHPYARFATLSIFPVLENCDAEQKKLDVVYRVFSINMGGALTRTFEMGDQGATRSVPDARATRILRSVQPSVFTGYDQARRLTAGGGVDLRFTERAHLLEHATVEASGSADSTLLRGAFGGHREFQNRPIQNVEWSLNYRYSRLPVNLASVRQGSLSLQVLATSRAWGDHDWIARFGASVEGGNRQSDLGALLLAPDEIANSGLGALKVFAGISGQPGPNSLKASYGVQLSNARFGGTLDYVKHIADFAHSVRLLPKWHRALTLDSKFTAGLIQIRGALPFAERFFGGNIEREFIKGASWTIRSNPFIRSVPFDRLGGFGRGGSGGDAFQAFNFTAGFTVWGKPLTPDELLGADGFDRAVEFQLKFPRALFFDEHLGQAPEFEPFRQKVLGFREILGRLAALVAKAEADDDEDVQDSASVVAGKVKRALDKFKDKEPAEIVPTDILALVEDFPATEEDPIPVASILGDIARSLANLHKLMESANILAEERKAIGEIRAQFEAETLKLLGEIKALEKSPAGIRAGQKADRDMRFPKRMLNAMLRDINLMGVSPVILFDAARIQQRTLGLSRALTGIGGGVKISVLALDLTGAYSWNPRRKPGEPPGAFVFSLDISDLFR